MAVTTTMKAIIRQMLALDQALGRSEAVTGLAAQSTTIGALASGGSAQQFVNEWLFRQDTATTADRIRRVTSFAPTTGAATHAGTAYSDTTVGTEIVEVLKHSPHLFSNAVNVTLARLKRNDRTIIPTLQSQDTVWLGGDVDWVVSPSDIMRICWSDNPVLTRNRFFQKYSSYNTSGILAPDFWTITGSGATMARSATQTRRQNPYSLAITRAGTDCYISQAPGLLENGVSAENLVGETVTAVAWAWSAVTSQVRVSISDGVTTTVGSYHTGGSGWEELTASATVGATATTLEMRINVVGSNTVAYVSEGYQIEASALTDNVRRDNFETTEREIPRKRYEQNGTLNVTLPERGRRGQWVVWSRRGYPQLDAVRFAAGTADADITDAPVIALATGAIARLYESLVDPEKPDSGPKFGPLAALWNERFGQLNAAHISPDDGPQPLGALNHRLQVLSTPAVRY